MRAMIRFGKQPRLRFISHLDLQRFFQRAVNRTGLPIAWSQGFNPHPVMSFGSALALGWTSEYEIIDIKLSAPHHFVKRLHVGKVDIPFKRGIFESLNEGFVNIGVVGTGGNTERKTHNSVRCEVWSVECEVWSVKCGV